MSLLLRSDGSRKSHLCRDDMMPLLQTDRPEPEPRSINMTWGKKAGNIGHLLTEIICGISYIHVSALALTSAYLAFAHTNQPTLKRDG